MRIRDARPGDAGALAAIYNPFILHSPVTFETEPVDAATMAERVRAVQKTLPFRVAERGGEVTGYAYAVPHRKRAAYAWSVETSIWVAPDQHRRGVGRALMVDLLDALTRRRFVMALAGVTLPNPGSVGLHESLGFEPIGVYRNVGFKAGAWRDVGWWQRGLADAVVPPSVPRDGAVGPPPSGPEAPKSERGQQE